MQKLYTLLHYVYYRLSNTFFFWDNETIEISMTYFGDCTLTVITAATNHIHTIQYNTIDDGFSILYKIQFHTKQILLDLCMYV